MFVLADIPQCNFAPVTLNLGSLGGKTVALQTSPWGWGASFNDNEKKKKKKVRKSELTTGSLPLYPPPPLPNLGEEAERRWGLDESERERRLRLIWREKLGIEGAPLRFAVFPPNRRAISHCSLRTTSPTWHAPAAASTHPVLVWFNALTPE